LLPRELAGFAGAGAVGITADAVRRVADIALALVTGGARDAVVRLRGADIARAVSAGRAVGVGARAGLPDSAAIARAPAVDVCLVFVLQAVGARLVDALARVADGRRRVIAIHAGIAPHTLPHEVADDAAAFIARCAARGVPRAARSAFTRAPQARVARIR